MGGQDLENFLASSLEVRRASRVPNYLHNHPEFSDLVKIAASQLAIAPILVEKDYWIMHVLYSLSRLGLSFQMKGGTSLSKGYKLINRFSEDIDILITPPNNQHIPTGKNQNSTTQFLARKHYYDWLADYIKMEGIQTVERDTHFDDVYCLLKEPRIIQFLSQDAYQTHKKRRFRQDDQLNISLNEAFKLDGIPVRAQYEKQYNQSLSLYCSHKPTFDEVMDLIGQHIHQM